MDVDAKLKSYHGFLLSLRYIALASIVVISFLVLTFCTTAGWGAGLFVAAIELAVGLNFAKVRRRLSWQSEVASLFVATAWESGQPIEPGSGATPYHPAIVDAPPSSDGHAARPRAA
jgi:hypothetical protein